MSRRSEIREALERLFEEEQDRLEAINPWGPDAMSRLRSYMDGGKMIRGSLVFMGEELFRKPRSRNSVRIASAMELLQAFLLIHDDIMDHDDLRRGKPSMHAQYREVASGKKGELRLENGGDYHLGVALAICVGDISAFLAFELVAQTDVPDNIRVHMLRLLSQEIVKVGVAQMQDVYNGYVRGDVSRENILSVYTYKTGRYTFSLPLMLGALLAEREEPSLLAELATIGERLGRAFQIKDDQLGLFGSAEKIGKPMGSDVKEDKKTIVRALLFESATEAEREELHSYFGDPAIGEKEIERVRRIAEAHEIPRLIQEQVDEENSALEAAIDGLTVRSEGKRLLTELFEYNRGRSS
ncbi:MAG: polyprenyl synthetase family protein [Spirochaetaceae bacterium]